MIIWDPTIKDSGERDLYELAGNVREGSGLSEFSEGADAIFQTLKGINDLVRLSALLKVEFPFDEYSIVANLPVICVEFAHLQEKTGGSGTLTLLDTPGPNEAGQHRLRPMLKEQLSKASAVLAVMDYTQLKSDADAQVRANLLEIAEVARGRLYAMVNKFDQSDRNGMKADEVRHLVQDLMSSPQGPAIQTEQIFPVSSRYAYLANRARHEVECHGRLPLPAEGTWVEDFGKLAFRSRWESKIEDSKEVQEAADELWEDSLFDAPLSGVIQMAYANAAVLAVDAASAKLLDYATRMSNQCNTRETALLADAQMLHDLVKELQDDIDRIERCEKTAKDCQEQQVKEFAAALDLHLKALKDDVQSQLELYFQSGKADEAARIAEQRRAKKEKKENDDSRAQNDPFYKFGRAFRYVARGHVESRHASDQSLDFDPNSPVIKFGADKKAAGALVEKIELSVVRIFDETGKHIGQSLDQGLREFENGFQKDVVAEAVGVLNDLLGKLKKSGFEAVSLRMPQERNMHLKLSGQHMLTEALETRTVSKSRLVDQDGWLGSVKRGLDFFGNEWGQDRIYYQENHYDLDISRIRENVLNQAEISFKGLQNALTSQVKKPLAQAVENFFKDFKDQVEMVRGDLLQGLRDKDKEKSERDRILAGLRDLQKDLPGQKEDADKLEKDVKQRLPESFQRQGVA